MVAIRVTSNSRNFNRAVDLYQQGKDKYDELSEKVDYSDDEKTPGLTPIGDKGLYATPDEPASPFDCDRYPDSPYCGGNPFNIEPVGLDPQIIINQCDIGIRLSPTIGFIKLPPVALVYRKEECRKPPPEPKQDPTQSSSSVWIPPTECNLEGGSLVVVLPDLLKFHEEFIFQDSVVYPERKLAVLDVIATITDIEITSFPDREITYVEFNNVFYPIYPVRFELKYKFKYKAVANDVHVFATGGTNAYMPVGYWQYGVSRIVEFEHDNSLSFTENDLTNINVIYTDRLLPGNNGRYWNSRYPEAMRALKGDEALNIPPLFVNSTVTAPIYSHATSVDSVRKQIGFSHSQQHFTVKIGCLKKGNYDKNPPPSVDKRKCCMTCCTPNNSSNDQLLKLLLKKVDTLATTTDKLSKVVGVEDYPVSLPESLISKDEGFIGNLIPNADVEITSLTKLFAWYIERFDEIMGQWEIPIEIKDSDPTTPGDQPKGIKLPNIAETLAEMFSLAFQTNINSETLLNFATRTLIETGQDKQQNFITYKLLNSLTDWAGFKYKDVKVDLPMSFTPGKQNFDELLKETNVSVGVPEFDEKFGLEGDLMKFRKASAVLDSVYFRKLNPNGDIKAQILDNVKNGLALAKEILEKEGKDFDKFVEDAELGFTNTPGITNTTEPYGRDMSQRPKIKDLTQKNNPTP